MSRYAFLSNALRYPGSGWLAGLESQLAELPPGPFGEAASAFVERVRDLPRGECEELYTRTWDLNPLAAPYVGYVLWGDDYKRGNFLVNLRQAYGRTAPGPTGTPGVNLLEAGELPDHLGPIFAYLNLAEQPIPELSEALTLALPKIAAEIEKKEPGNPYGALLEAASHDQ